MKMTKPPDRSCDQRASSANAGTEAASASSATSALRAGRFTSVRVLPRLLDDRPPLRDLGREVLLEIGRGGLLRRHRLGAEVGEALLHALVLQRGLQRFDQLVDDRLR